MNCHVVLFTFTQALYYHLTFDVEKKVDCRFLCSKRWFKAFLQCSCLWFLIVWSQCYNLRQSSSPFHGRWCLGTLDSTDESHYISNPVNYLGCISETCANPTNDGIIYILTSQLVQDFFGLSTASQHAFLDFPSVTDQSPINIKSAGCDVKVIKEGPSSEEGAYVWSLKRAGEVFICFKKVNCELVVLQNSVDSFFSKRLELFGLGVCLCGGHGGSVMTVTMKLGRSPCVFSQFFSYPKLTELAWSRIHIADFLRLDTTRLGWPATRIPLRSHLVYFDRGRLGLQNQEELSGNRDRLEDQHLIKSCSFMSLDWWLMTYSGFDMMWYDVKWCIS